MLPLIPITKVMADMADRAEQDKAYLEFLKRDAEYLGLTIEQAAWFEANIPGWQFLFTNPLPRMDNGAD